MSNVGYATLQVIPSMQGIESKLQSGLAGPMTSAGTKAGKTLGTSTSKSFGGAIKGVATLATGLGAYFVGSKLHEFFSSSIAEARESQKVTAQTAAVLKSTGGAANVSAKQIGSLATAISNKVGIDDEAIQSGENLLLTFRNIRNEAGKGNDIFDKATQAITDLSVGMGQDLKSSAVQVGKALNDPIKGITALSRVGVTFTEQQKAQIKTLVDSGNTLKAQKIILGELNKEFAGSAAAQATAADKLKVAWGNFEEQIGKALLPVLDDLANWLLRVGPPAAEKFVGWFKGDGIKGIRDFGQNVADLAKNLEPTAASLLHAGKDALPALAGGLKSAVPLLKTLADTFNSLPKDAQKLIVIGAGAKYMSSQIGGVNGLLPGFNAGLAGIARNGPGAGSGLSSLKSALGTAGAYVGIAAGLDAIANVVAEIKAEMSSGPALGGTSLPAVVDQMSRSGLSDFLKNAGVNVHDFAKNLHDAGANGIEVRGVLEDLEKKAGGATAGFSRLGGTRAQLDRLTGIIPIIGDDLQTGGLEAFKARKKILDLIAAIKELHKEARGNKATRFDTAVAIQPALAGLRDYRTALLKLPDKVLTKVETPGSIQSVKDVEGLQKKFKLQPREVRTIMKALDFATPKIRKVMKDLGAVHHESKPIPITADARKANQQIELTGHSLFKLDRTKTNPKLNADGRPLMTASQKALQILHLVGIQHPKALISVEAGAALQTLARVRNEISAIPTSKTTVLTTIHRGGIQKATGGYITGPGTGTSDSIPAMLSNGEFVINAAATRRHLALLQSINAQRFATGGQVGGSSGSSSSGGTLRIVGTLDTPFGPAEIRGVVEDTIAVRGAHDARMAANA